MENEKNCEQAVDYGKTLCLFAGECSVHADDYKNCSMHLPIPNYPTIICRHQDEWRAQYRRLRKEYEGK
jgi:hypothetical protein